MRREAKRFRSRGEEEETAQEGETCPAAAQDEWPSRWDLRGQGAGSPRSVLQTVLPSWTLGVALVLE